MAIDLGRTGKNSPFEGRSVSRDGNLSSSQDLIGHEHFLFLGHATQEEFLPAEHSGK